MSRAVRFLSPRAVARARVAATLAVLVVGLGACGTAATLPTTTTLGHQTGAKVLSVAQLRTLYVKETAVANTAFANFTADFAGATNGGAAPRVASPAEANAAKAAAKVLQNSANQLYALANEAPAKIKSDLRSLIAAESPVFQALLDLSIGYQSHAFDLASWEKALGNAAALADQVAQTVAEDLGLPNPANG